MLLFDYIHSLYSFALDPFTLLLAFVGVTLGIVLGAIPGISSTMAIAIMLPVTFSMSAEVAIFFLIAIFVSSVYGGSVSAILLNIPGTPASIITQADGCPMAKSGKPGQALIYALVASTIGGFIGLGLLVILAPGLASAASNFRSPEFAMVALFGLVMLAYSSPGPTSKAIAVGAVGVLLGMVGFDSITDVERFTLSSPAIQSGIDLIPVIIGLFGLSEVLTNLSSKGSAGSPVKLTGKLFPPIRSFFESWGVMLRGSLIGTFVGAIPAAGSAVAVSIAYSVEKRISKTKEKFGTGCPDGIMSPESANSSSVGGSLIPMMTLGIPGDTITAVLMGALLIHGLQPGPLLFANNPEFVASVYSSLALSLLITFAVGLVLVRWSVKLYLIPAKALMILVAFFCVVGSFAIRNDINDVYIMVVFGVVGYVFNYLKLPVAPLAFGLILGPVLEENLRRSLMLSQGSWNIFFERPISLALLLLSTLAIVSPFISSCRVIYRKKGRV